MPALISADIHEEISAISSRAAVQVFLQLLVQLHGPTLHLRIDWQLSGCTGSSLDNLLLCELLGDVHVKVGSPRSGCCAVSQQRAGDPSGGRESTQILVLLPSAPLMCQYQCLVLLVKIQWRRKITVLVNPSFSFKCPATQQLPRPGQHFPKWTSQFTDLFCETTFLAVSKRRWWWQNLPNAFCVPSPELRLFPGLFHLIDRTAKGQVMELLSPAQVGSCSCGRGSVRRSWPVSLLTNSRDAFYARSGSQSHQDAVAVMHSSARVHVTLSQAFPCTQ